MTRTTIQRAVITELALPFRFSFGHAATSRRRSDSVLVELQTDAGVSGWGEALPREYVTGESLAATFDASVVAADALVSQPVPANLGELAGLLEQLALPPNPRCALELALLDLMAKGREVPVVALFGEPARDRARFSAVLPLQRPALVRPMAWAAKAWGFGDVKLKAGRDPDRDTANVRAVQRAFGPDVPLRVDANGAWSVDEAADRVAHLASLGVTVIEQPVGFRALAEFTALRAQTPDGIELLADESCCDEGDLAQLIAGGGVSGVQLKIAKHGGLAPSIELAATALAAGLSVRLGCHVGESSVITAAGRTFAALTPALGSCEGGYGPVLLSKDVTRRSLGLARGGWATLVEPGPGWGVDVDPARVARSSTRARARSVGVPRPLFSDGYGADRRCGSSQV